MRVRVIGSPGEAALVVDLLRAASEVIEVSRPYPCRGSAHLVRVYIYARPRPEGRSNWP
ncbi:MAG: hypothetical protein ACRDUA_14380 [Micromonosporaceae bacterium]